MAQDCRPHNGRAGFEPRCSAGGGLDKSGRLEGWGGGEASQDAVVVSWLANREDPPNTSKGPACGSWVFMPTGPLPASCTCHIPTPSLVTYHFPDLGRSFPAFQVQLTGASSREPSLMSPLKPQGPQAPSGPTTSLPSSIPLHFYSRSPNARMPTAWVQIPTPPLQDVRSTLPVPRVPHL